MAAQEPRLQYYRISKDTKLCFCLKKLNLSFLLALLISMTGTKVYAYDAQIDGIYYTFSEAGATVTYQYRGNHPVPGNGYSGRSDYTGNIVIPETVNCNGITYKVTSISNDAFMGCSGLNSVFIPNTIMSIGSRAFALCSNLTSVNIPNTVTSIEWATFSDCNSLSSISIPNSITNIGSSAFSGCKLTDVSIPNSVTSVGSNAFYNTPWYNNQPDGLIYVGKAAYCYKGAMPANTNIIIKDGTESISSGAFLRCYGLTSVTIPSSVKTIDNAFNGCTGLKKVIVKDIAAWCAISFDSYNSLLYYAHHLYSDEDTEITNLVIPNSVTKISDCAFLGCTGIQSVSIPNSVTSVGIQAFDGTTWYNNQPDGLVYIGKVAYKYKGMMPANTRIDIKEGSVSISPGAFLDCRGLTSITIPNSVTNIGKHAFNGCI